MSNKLHVLFLCTGNSCRSQMAEGWARHLKSQSIQSYSAGTNPKGIDPMAVEIMREAGVDISKYSSKHVNDLLSLPLDYVITVCDAASEACPVFPGKAKVMHQGFDDPPALAQHATSHEEKRRIYRRVRDEVRAFIETLPQALELRATKP